MGRTGGGGGGVDGLAGGGVLDAFIYWHYLSAICY